MKYFFKYLLAQIFLVHCGKTPYKIDAVIILGVVFSPFAYLLEKLSVWGAENETYIIYVTGAVILDHAIGSIYHAYWLKDFTFKQNAIGLLVKMSMVVTVGYVVEGANALMISNIVRDYSVATMRLMVFLYPAGSLLGNSYIMTNKKFPPKFIMDFLVEFNLKGKIK